jgi:hypothetical protein
MKKLFLATLIGCSSLVIPARMRADDQTMKTAKDLLLVTFISGLVIEGVQEAYKHELYKSAWKFAREHTGLTIAGVGAVASVGVICKEPFKNVVINPFTNLYYKITNKKQQTT